MPFQSTKRSSAHLLSIPSSLAPHIHSSYDPSHYLGGIKRRQGRSLQIIIIEIEQERERKRPINSQSTNPDLQSLPVALNKLISSSSSLQFFPTPKSCFETILRLRLTSSPDKSSSSPELQTLKETIIRLLLSLYSISSWCNQIKDYK